MLLVRLHQQFQLRCHQPALLRKRYATPEGCVASILRFQRSGPAVAVSALKPLGDGECSSVDPAELPVINVASKSKPIIITRYRRPREATAQLRQARLERGRKLSEELAAGRTRLLHPESLNSAAATQASPIASSPSCIVIDAYNVLYKHEALQKALSMDLAYARAELERWSEAWAFLHSTSILLVYDAQNRFRNAQHTSLPAATHIESVAQSVWRVYVHETDADTYIISATRKLKAAGCNVAVMSADNKVLDDTAASGVRHCADVTSMLDHMRLSAEQPLPHVDIVASELRAAAAAKRKRALQAAGDLAASSSLTQESAPSKDLLKDRLRQILLKSAKESTYSTSNADDEALKADAIVEALLPLSITPASLLGSRSPSIDDLLKS